jgi:hypothetical protein
VLCGFDVQSIFPVSGSNFFCSYVVEPNITVSIEI